MPRARNKRREDEQTGERARPSQDAHELKAAHEPNPPEHAGSLTRSTRERRAAFGTPNSAQHLQVVTA
jgi:hypothetical protein